MPTIDDANSSVTQTRTCPLCDTPLDENKPAECPKCDWHVGYREENLGSGRDVAAVLMSVIPGLGHIYKGHRMTGALYMLGAVFALVACSVAATFTAGFGLLLLPLYWAGVMLQVFWLEDRVAAQARLELKRKQQQAAG
ncbi:MAG: hypothetical protein QOE70_4907 [Chthoniobacter sp.]|jgi:uncharacterized paraquat-inducible protein A|nr:hypothetical protein [Chthoniobacter sp.]